MIGCNCNEETALYYLYMMADGKVAHNEKKIFDKICEDLQVDVDTKNEVIERCKELSADKADVFDIIVREKIDEHVGHEWNRLRDTSSLARVIWNLINLGYADSFYSEEEKEIVNYLVDQWSVSLEVYQELVDIADTMLALTKQKEWIVSTFPKGSIRNKKKEKVDSEIEQLLGDVKLTIQELAV